jgi:hypothetical protein
MLPSSPFSKTELQTLGTFSKKGSHIGLLLPDGRILINFADSTHQSVLTEVAEALGAELISIPGTWTFEPDEGTEFKRIARHKS